jgi:hypothetical protein
VVIGAATTVRASVMLGSLAEPTAIATTPTPRIGVTPTVPGWYHDPSGVATHQAWWDGQRWTGATRPDPGEFPPA